MKVHKWSSPSLPAETTFTSLVYMCFRLSFYSTKRVYLCNWPVCVHVCLGPCLTLCGVRLPGSSIHGICGKNTERVPISSSLGSSRLMKPVSPVLTERLWPLEHWEAEISSPIFPCTLPSCGQAGTLLKLSAHVLFYLINGAISSLKECIMD